MVFGRVNKRHSKIKSHNYYNKANMRKLLIVLTVTAVTISCQNQAKRDNQTDTKKETIDLVQKQKNDSIQKAKEDSIAKVNAAQLEENKKRLAVLKKNFKYKEDEFNKTGWYTHKNQTVDNSWNRKCLKAHVNSNGYIYLEDQYYSEDWIFHSRIEVKIGDNIYKSEDVPTYSEDNKTENSSGSVWENVSYTGDKDNGIIKAIAESVDKPVKVRFIGREYYSDFTLSNKDKQAIKDSYELSNLIKKIGE